MLIDRKKIRSLMKQKGLTQENLVPILGVKTRAAVGHKLTGLRGMSLSQFYALARYLGVEPEELLDKGATERMEPAPGIEPLTARLLRIVQSLSPRRQRLLLAIAHEFQDGGWQEAPETENGLLPNNVMRSSALGSDQRRWSRREVRDRRQDNRDRRQSM